MKLAGHEVALTAVTLIVAFNSFYGLYCKTSNKCQALINAGGSDVCALL